MRAWHQQFCAFGVLQKELLIVQGSGDTTVDWRYNVPLVQAKLPCSALVMVEGAGHQLINELPEYRDQVMAAVNQYFNV
jgi:alpha-beta hydrolase superfamily lysophospholipase